MPDRFRIVEIFGWGDEGHLGMGKRNQKELCWPGRSLPGANCSSSKRVWRRTLGHCRAFCGWWHSNGAAWGLPMCLAFWWMNEGMMIGVAVACHVWKQKTSEVKRESITLTPLIILRIQILVCFSCQFQHSSFHQDQPGPRWPRGRGRPSTRLHCLGAVAGGGFGRRWRGATASSGASAACPDDAAGAPAVSNDVDFWWQ